MDALKEHLRFLVLMLIAGLGVGALTMSSPTFANLPIPSFAWVLVAMLGLESTAFLSGRSDEMFRRPTEVRFIGLLLGVGAAMLLPILVGAPPPQ